MLSFPCLLALFTGFQVLLGAKIDSHFSHEPEDLHLKEISDNVRQVSSVVMGLAEYVLEIRGELRSIRADLSDSRSNATKTRPDSYFSKPLRNPDEVRRQSLELADKVEKLLALEQSPEVDLAKEELKRTVEKNFLRMLAAILVTGPAHTQERSDDIFKLMRSVLNGELDFTPVVQKLPLILRDSETNQFVNLLITLRESERGSSFRQGLLNSVGDTAQSAQYIYPAQISAVNYPAQVGTVDYRQQNNRVTGGVPASAVGSNNNLNNVNAGVVGANGQVGNIQNANINQQNQQMNQQLNQLPTIDNILMAMTQTNNLIQQIPSLVEGLQTIVESLEGLFG